MRNWTVWILVVLAIAACGATNRDVALAKTARYKGDKLALFKAAKDVTESKHPLDASDETTLTVITKGRWFTPEGLVSNWKPGDQINGKDRLDDHSLNVQLVVKILPDGENWIVHVEPKYLEFRQGRPNLDPLKPEDPSIPGWARGKVDQLAYDIYTALKPFEVQGVGGVAPAPTPTAAPAPAPGPAGDPGSAAPPPSS